MMTIREAARKNILPEYTLRKMVKAGQIPHIKIGKKAFINYDCFVDLLNHWGQAKEGEAWQPKN